MYYFYNFIAFLTLLASVKPDDIDPTPPPVKAKATVSFGEPRFFSGEDVQMTCSVPDDPLPNWTYQWFHDGVALTTTEVYSIRKARVLQSGSYTCQGQKTITAWPYIITSIPSDPLKIHVDGGWVLLRTPIEPLIIEETMTLTCRVRYNPILESVVFYKGEAEVRKLKDKHLVVSNLKLEDDDMYSCKATWTENQEYHSAQSLPSFVTVLDKLETPTLAIPTRQGKVRSGKDVSFICTTKLNAREQGLSVEYYYLKDGERLGPVSARNTYVISPVSEDDAGFYTCKVRVRALNVERLSNQVELQVLRPLNL